MISALIETGAAARKLERWGKALRARLGEGFAAGAQTLLESARGKVSGDVLQARTGALRASLRAEVTETAGGFAALVWSDGSVRYARIQEYGGRIAVPEIVPKNAKSLAFVYGGRMVFAKRAAAHVVVLPERSYMRASLAEFAPPFLDGIRRLAADLAP